MRAAALVLLLGSGCGSSPPPPAARSPAVPPSSTIAVRAPAAPSSGECAAVISAIADAVAESPDANLHRDTTYDQHMARTAQLSERGARLVALRDRLRTPLLATRTNDFAQTTHYLAYLSASRAAATRLADVDVTSYEHGLEIGARQRELARRAALAECTDDGSRDQSDAWKEVAMGRLHAVRGALATCFREATAREPGHPIAMQLKVRIGPDGHVVVAGPDRPYDLPGGSFSAELAYCVVREVEKVTFPPPSGDAVMVIPLEHAGS